MTMFIERRGSSRHGSQKRVLLSPKGFTQALFEDMAAYGLFSDSEDLSDPDNAVHLSDRHQDSIKASQSSRVRVRISANPQGKDHQTSSIQQHKEYDEPDSTAMVLSEDNPTPVLRRKRSPSPTPSMTSTSSTEETVRPARKKTSIMKPLKKFKEVVPVVHVPEFKEAAVKPKRFQEMSPSRMGDPVIISPKSKALVSKKIEPEVKKVIAAPLSNDKTRKVRFVLRTEDRDDSSSPLAGTAKRLS